MKKQALELPVELRSKYRLTRALYGGPTFDIPSIGLSRVNITTLTEAKAEQLLRKGWTGLARIEKKDKVAPASAPDTAQQ